MLHKEKVYYSHYILIMFIIDFLFIYLLCYRRRHKTSKDSSGLLKQLFLSQHNVNKYLILNHGCRFFYSHERIFNFEHSWTNQIVFYVLDLIFLFLLLSTDFPHSWSQRCLSACLFFVIYISFSILFLKNFLSLDYLHPNYSSFGNKIQMSILVIFFVSAK